MLKKTCQLLIFIFNVLLIEAQPMQYISCTAGPVTNTVRVDKILPFIKIAIVTDGTGNPLSALQFQLASPLSKISSGECKLYYTGTSDSFATSSLFATLQWNKQMQINGEQTLQAGANYFWLAADVSNNPSQKIPKIKFISCTTGLQDYQQVWADEFDTDGPPDSANWRFERGFVRNEEDQWYQEENAQCKNGILTIEARRDSIPNPRYEAGSRDWRKSRPFIRYTSSSINTRGKYACTYGRLQMRARLDTNAGCWPAWWALGTEGGAWPNNGEIDMMEFYRGKILANYAVATQKPNTPKWFSTATPLADFGKQNWTDSFHHWRMDWDSAGMAIYLDDVLLNYQPQSNLYNRSGANNYYPFRHPQYMLLNFAIGGQNGGDPSNTTFPRKYEIDYIRVSQKINGTYSSQKVHTPVMMKEHRQRQDKIQ